MTIEAAAAPDGTSLWEVYARAEQYLPWQIQQRVPETPLVPHWLGDGLRFWYRAGTSASWQFVLVDPRDGTRAPAFDHQAVARALSAARGRAVAADRLPLDDLTLSEEGQLIGFAAEGSLWRYDWLRGRCEPAGSLALASEVWSPDGRWAARVQEHNLVVRATATGALLPLTRDGTADWSYATPLQSPLHAAGLTEAAPPPALLWSPDGQRLISHRIDQRAAGRLSLLQAIPTDGSLRPRVHSYSYPLPGEQSVPLAELLIWDVAQQRCCPVALEPLPVLYYGSPLRPGWVWWSQDSARVYLLWSARGFRSYALSVIDAQTGAARLLIEERAASQIQPSPAHAYSDQPLVRPVGDGAEIVWFSQRDGWGHLYLYDGASGQLRRQLTAGPWIVTGIVHIDAAARLVYFTAAGREPDRDLYAPHLYRASLDGGEPQLLTPEDATHQISWASGGQLFIDTFSQVDRAPVSVARRADGRLLCEVERLDLGALEALGWRPPERFRVKARDGVTDVYGVMLRPSRFDPAVPLPILDCIYAGPHVNHAPAAFPSPARGAFWQAQALAELGFVVVMIDGLGMPGRSKAFHDVSYRNLADAGLPDHIAALEQLTERYPYLDRSRVGVYGHSAGGYAAARALLAYPDVFSVAVAVAGNHDHRLDKAGWIERFMGLPVDQHYEEQANAALAAQLRGRLLLIHGEMDENVHPAATLRLVDALIAADKDFDLLILPNRTHACTSDRYVIRRCWDYFVRHLQRRPPPRDYHIQPPC